jgi:hypothetical protein
MDDPRYKVAAIEAEDARCKSLLKRLRYSVSIEMDDPRCKSTATEMDDPRCWNFSRGR